jgi:glycogen(starch) synthase
MRILVVSNLYPPGFQGGYELGCAHVTEELRRAGHDVRVLTSGKGDHEQSVARRLTLFPIFDPSVIENADPEERRTLAAHARLFDADNIDALANEISCFRPDVVYLWNLLGVGGLGLVGWLEAHGIPWVWHLMDAVPRQLCTLDRDPAPALTEAFAATVSGRYLACSTHLIGEIQRGGFELGAPVRMVPNWLAGELPPARSRFFSSGDPELRLVTAVGVLVEHKGIDLLIEAAAALELTAPGRFSIDVFGRQDDDRFRLLASELGIDHVVRFCGVAKQQELIRRLAGYDVFAFPTEWREPFGFAALEAAAAGCVPLVAENCGIAEWMVGGVHCVKARRTPQAFADALAAILHGEIDLAPIGRRAQAVVRDAFWLPRLVRNIEATLADAAANQPRQRSPRLLEAAANELKRAA